MSGLPQEQKRFSFLSGEPQKRVYCRESHLLKGEGCEETYTEVFRAPAPQTIRCRKCLVPTDGSIKLPDPMNISPSYPTSDPVIL